MEKIFDVLKNQALFLFCLVGVKAQVGVNTENPQATLDIRATNHLGTVTSNDGLLVPRVANIDVSGTTNGQLVFLVASYGAYSSGFYYWNGANWQSLESPINSINGLVESNQTLEIGSAGTDVNIASYSGQHRFNFPSASATTRGVLTNSDWTAFNGKIGGVTATTTAAVSTVGNQATILNASALWNANRLQGNNVSNTVPTDGQILAWSGTSNQWRPIRSTYIKTSDQATTSTALSSISNFSMSVVSGLRYILNCRIAYTSSSTANGIGLGVTSPAGTISLNLDIPNGGDGTAATRHGWLTSSGDNSVATSTPAANVQHISEINGLIIPTASGTVQLTFRSEVNANTTTVKANSVCFLEEY